MFCTNAGVTIHNAKVSYTDIRIRYKFVYYETKELILNADKKLVPDG
jgi:hypothetical protein